jgi:tetratricopeptide (TPR) repeat protein
MLQTIREYGLERLEERGEAEALHRHHASFFAALAEQLERDSLCTGPSSVYGSADAERDNFRAALDWSQAERGDTETGLRLVAALVTFWGFGEYVTEGRARAEEILARPDAARYPEARAGALLTVGALEALRSNHAPALARLHESLQLLRATGDGARLGQAVTWLGMTALGQGDSQAALRWFCEARELARGENRPWVEATALSFIAELMVLPGDLDQVRAMAEEALGRYRALQDAWGTARTQRLLAGLAWMAGDYATAHRLGAEAVGLLREVGERWNLGRALTRMGIILIDEANYGEAEGTLTESLMTWRDLGNDAGMILSLAGLTLVAAARGQTERVQRLYAAEPLHRAAGGVLLDSLSPLEFDHVMGRLRGQLGDRPPGDRPLIALEEAVRYALEQPSAAVS